MFTFLSLITSIKDYVEVVHKLVETDSNLTIHSYYDFGSVFTFIILTGKDLLEKIFTFQWLQNLWSIPTIVPDIASSLISEISVFDGYFKNTQTFLESPFSYGNQNFFFYCLEKFTIGFLNSIFLCFPTSIAHIITLRRFVMQGLEAGFLSGLGTIVGNIVWIGSILFGFRFFVIPWLSLDLFRYLLGFLLIVKYIWDSSRERRMVLEDFSKYKIFFLTFLLSFTEQTTLYPFISNLSFGSDSTLLESFPTASFAEFTLVHCFYLLGILLGSLSLLQFTCWFWENPAFQIYMWFISSFQITKNFSSLNGPKFVNFIFLYLTMICAIANFSYFGLDYTLTNPLGFVHEDRLFEQKVFLETAFLNSKASDRNTRRNRGRHGRRERWKRRIRKYRTFDASFYDQGVYDLFTIEDLNYGFDRFWLRRKIRNHRVRFRFFPGPWMRNFKKQLARPRLESYLGPRVEFFRILFEQAYHPEFHEFSASQRAQTNKKNILFQPLESKSKNFSLKGFDTNTNQNIISWNIQSNKKQRILKERSAYRKFTRKVQTRLKKAKIDGETQKPLYLQFSFENSQNLLKPLSSKTWKTFGGIQKNSNSLKTSSTFFPNSSDFQNSGLLLQKQRDDNYYFQRFYKKLFTESGEKPKRHFSKKERFVQRYKNFLMTSAVSLQNEPRLLMSDVRQDFEKTKNILFSSDSPSTPSKYETSQKQSTNRILEQTEKQENLWGPQKNQNESQYRPLMLLHPLQFYFQKEQALKRKFQFYGVKLYRNYGVENNAPYFRVLMKRFFYHYKPTLRWERTLRVASTRRARRKNSRMPKKFNIEKSTQLLALQSQQNQSFSDRRAKGDTLELQKDQNEANFDILKNFNTNNISNPTHFYSLVDKRASRYRFQIYKDVLQHWYYSPLNRLLLKFDIDSFIRRQPNSYFLTKNDEKFLHLKRQLLSEYYETLRWYTSMENYSTMKNQIGGTKSLSTRAYNQQFAGTFKKIRHLFNISPSFLENTVLKFDQPLYNEYVTSGGFAPVVQRASGADALPTAKQIASRDSFLHEELFSENFFSNGKAKNVETPTNQPAALSFSSPPRNPENVLNQSITILREYLATAAPIRQQYIENLLEEKNYWELSRFLFRGQKVRGIRAVTNETDFLNQEKSLLLVDSRGANENYSNSSDFYSLKDEMWISLLKKCQKKLYDQEALKKYVALKKEKYEIQKQRHEKYLKNRFQRIQEAVFKNAEYKPDEIKNTIHNFENFTGYPSSLRKAMQESILWEKNSSSSFQTFEKAFSEKDLSTYGKKLFLEKTNIRKNQFPMYSLLKKENPFFQKQKKFSIHMNNEKTKSQMFTKNLRFVIKKQAIQILHAENEVGNNFLNSSKKSKFVYLPFSKIYDFAFGKIKKVFSHIHSKTYRFQNDSDFFKNKNIEFWKKRENILLKRKKLRKTLKRLRNQKIQTDKIVFGPVSSVSDLSQSRLLLPSRARKIDQASFFGLQTDAASRSQSEKKGIRSADRSAVQMSRKNDFFNSVQNKRDFNTENREKKDKNFNISISANASRSWQNYLNQEGIPQSRKEETIDLRETKQEKNLKTFAFFKNLGASTSKKYRLRSSKKRTRLRRYSFFKGRGPIKKRTLREKLKRQFKSLKKYGKTQKRVFSEKQKEQEKKKVELIQFITQRNSGPNGKFVKQNEKQRRTRQMKQRAWKKKKQNFAQKRRKLRKRRRSTLSKIRVYNKKIYKIFSRKDIQTWWWKTFFPHFQKTTETNWQSQKNKEIQKQLFDLSEKEIFERDKKNISQFANNNSFQQNSRLSVQSPGGDIDFLQIGNKDFKPFAIPETLRIREKLVQKNLLHFHQQDGKTAHELSTSSFLKGDKNQNVIPVDRNEKIHEEPIFQKVNNSLFVSQQSENLKTKELSNSPFLIPTNPLPFYAGWDNSLRKFVLTNRLQARKDSLSCIRVACDHSLCFPLPKRLGEQPSPSPTAKQNPLCPPSQSERMQSEWTGKEKSGPLTQSVREEMLSPLQGMNAATTLYWQIPFTTYDPDQFFALGMDGFSPIGWRHFSLKHSKQTTKPMLVKNFYSFGLEKSKTNKSNNFFTDLRFKISQQTFSPNNHFLKRKQEINKNFEYRRILKKQKRLKKHPRPPVWFPSGSLSQQVLPVHYIYVFYKRSRLPRDRYIRRRLRNNFLNTQNSRQETNFTDRTKMIEFTLRKRIKPRRKYHRKRFGDFSEKNQFLAQRRKFRSFFDDSETSRPSSKLFLDTSLTTGIKQDKKLLGPIRGTKAEGRGSKQRRKIQDSKQPNENLRVRQLRRRVQRQVYRPVWRSRPRAGGFVWPGDYLRLESVKASPLKSAPFSNKKETPLEFENSQASPRKIRKKTRRTLQEWQIQPKKYLFEKHNLKVLKKRIEKSMNFQIS